MGNLLRFSFLDISSLVILWQNLARWRCFATHAIAPIENDAARDKASQSKITTPLKRRDVVHSACTVAIDT
jgi:hypothetical protein